MQQIYLGLMRSTSRTAADLHRTIIMRSPRLLMLFAVAFALGGISTWWYLRLPRQPPGANAYPTARTTVAPSKVSKPVDETSLNCLELSSDAIRRLGIRSQILENRSMPRYRSYGAEFVLPTDASVIVSSPLSGNVRRPPNGQIPAVGQNVRSGETVLEILPLLTPERSVLTPAERVRFAESKATVAQAQIDADGQVQQSTVQVEAAQVVLARAEKLYEEGVGTARAVDDAKAQLELAEKALSAARQRKTLVDSIKLDEEAGTLAPLAVESPMEGIIRATHVQAGQVVSGGAPLFEVMNDLNLWIKVPVYVGELEDIDAAKPARLTLLDGRPTGQDSIGTPVSLPPTAVPLSSSVDLYYSVPNRERKFRPGQRIAANLPIRGNTDMLAVPWSAVLYDIYGGQWVYEQVAEHRFARRRVDVGWVHDGWAALRRGPAVGVVVVTAGVAELAGVEFGFAK